MREHAQSRAQYEFRQEKKRPPGAVQRAHNITINAVYANVYIIDYKDRNR